MEKNDTRKILIFRHYLSRVKDFDVNKLKKVTDDYEESPKVVLKEESDANILQAYIAGKLGLVTPNIYPMYSQKDNKVIVAGELELPKNYDKNNIVFGNEYNNILNFKTLMELSDKLSEEEHLTKAEENIFANIYSRGILSKEEGTKPADEFLNDKYKGFFSEYFEKKAIKDIIKSRVARIVTYDKSLLPSANLYYIDNNTHRVTDVFPIYNNIDRMTIYAQICDKDTSKIVDKYQSEFSKKALPLKEIVRCMKENEIIQDAFSNKGLNELGKRLGNISTKEYEKEYLDKNSGYEISKKYSSFVSSKIEEVANELTR